MTDPYSVILKIQWFFVQNPPPLWNCLYALEALPRKAQKTFPIASQLDDAQLHETRAKAWIINNCFINLSPRYGLVYWSRNNGERQGIPALFWQVLTKKLAGKKSSTSKPIKDKHGNTLTKQEEQLRRWGEYFEELLNRPPPIPEAELMLDVNTTKPNKEEIAKAIRNQKNGKAPGPDGISVEILKGDINTSTQMLYEIYAKVWEEETIPEDWKEGHLVKIPKKGDLTNCNNYRGITMLSVPGKILSQIILQRLIDALDKILRDQQMGFRKNRSCTDHIATLRIIAEQSLEWNTSLYTTYVDFEKAFDSVDHSTLWNLENPMPLWNSREVHCYHTEVVLQFPNQSNIQWWTYTAFLHEDWSSTRLHPITHAFSFGYWLVNENNNRRFQDRNTMVSSFPTPWSRLRRWHRSTFPQS